jgi:hypothetical protein
MRKLGGDKRGQNMTLGTIILIVLGIAVLVFLIFGFSTGWSNLWSKITAFGGGSANVDTIKQACILACNTDATTRFCQEAQTVKFTDGSKIRGSCENLKGELGISCDISCGTSTYEQTCEDKGWKLVSQEEYNEKGLAVYTPKGENKLDVSGSLCVSEVE